MENFVKGKQREFDFKMSKGEIEKSSGNQIVLCQQLWRLEVCLEFMGQKKE